MATHRDPLEEARLYVGSIRLNLAQLAFAQQINSDDDGIDYRQEIMELADALQRAQRRVERLEGHSR